MREFLHAGARAQVGCLAAHKTLWRCATVRDSVGLSRTSPRFRPCTVAPACPGLFFRAGRLERQARGSERHEKTAVTRRGMGLTLAPRTSLLHSTEIGPPLACRRYRKHPPAPPRHCACGSQSSNETFGGWRGGENVAGVTSSISPLSPGLGRGFFLKTEFPPGDEARRDRFRLVRGGGCSIEP